MREQRTRRTIKLRLFALVLALALTWYSLNPPLRSVRKSTPEVEPPDEKRREVQPRKSATRFLLGDYGARWSEALEFAPSQAEDPDDFEWPEFIDG